MRALALFPLSAIAVFPPSLLAVYELGQQSSIIPAANSQRLEAAAKTDSSAVLEKAQAIAQPKSLTPQPIPEAKTRPQFSSMLPPPPSPPRAQKSVSLDPIPDVSTLPIDQIVSQSLGVEVSRIQAKSTSPVVAVNSLLIPVVTDPPEMISQVEVTPQALPTPAPTPIPSEIAPSSPPSPSSIQTEPSISPPDALGGASVDETYALGAGDRIQITLLNVPEYSGVQQVLADGSVNLPLIGKVSIKGMTLPEAEAAIAKRYESELRYAVVTLILVQPRPLRIAIAGEVQNPGSYTLPLAEESQFPSIAQAIQEAGGVTQAANLHQVQIRRQQINSSQTIVLNLWNLVKDGDLSQNIALRDGDTIMIPAATEVNMAETAQLADSNLAASVGQSLDVAIVGEIFRPGAYKMVATGSSGASSDRPRITQAIQMAGGVKPSADLRQVQVRRMTRNGVEQLINVDFWKLLQAGDSSQNLFLQQGDTIIIPLAQNTTPAEASQLASANLSPDAIQINVVGEVKVPGTVQLPANTTLNQALLAAGGLNARAAKEVELIRLNPNGTITQQRIDVDLREGVDAERNPILWHNDIIIAGRSRSARIGDQINSILGPILQIVSPLRTLLP